MARSAFVVACILLSALSGAQAEEGKTNAGKEVVERRLGADRFIAGSAVRVSAPVAGDLIAAGGNVDVDDRVDGDALLSGGNLRVTGAVGDALYAGAGQMTISGSIAHNARIAGGRVEVDPRAVIGGNLSVAGGQVGMAGEVRGYVQAAGGNIYINGPVGGDVVAAGGQVELGPRARIAGELRYASREELRRDPAAQVADGIKRMQADIGWRREQREIRGAGWIWTAGLMVLAAVLVMAAPAFTARVAGTVQTRIGWSLLIGFIALVCVPVVIVLLLVTIIGIPVALLTLVLYLALLLAGYAVTGIGLGDWVLKRWRGAAVSTGWRALAALLAVLVIALLGRLPFIGGLIVFAALLAGLGALVMQLRPAQAAA